jgi:hypothetical protein
MTSTSIIILKYNEPVLVKSEHYVKHGQHLAVVVQTDDRPIVAQKKRGPREQFFIPTKRRHSQI